MGAATERLDVKIRRLQAIEASYNQEIKWAEADVKRDPEGRRRYERSIEKSRKKIAKILPKIHALLEKRGRLKARGL